MSSSWRFPLELPGPKFASIPWRRLLPVWSEETVNLFRSVDRLRSIWNISMSILDFYCISETAKSWYAAILDLLLEALQLSSNITVLCEPR